MGCHGNYAISHNQNGFIIEEHKLFAFEWPYESFDISNKCSKEFNVDRIPPWVPKLCNSFASFFKVFINIHEYANEMIFI